MRWTSGLMVVLLHFLAVAVAEVVEMTKANHDMLLASNELVFVNFYADWCRFSQMAKPIFSEASGKLTDQPAGKIVFAGLNAEQQQELAQKYQVNKYPTFKLIRNGEVTKREYRGQRSVDAFVEYVQKQSVSSVQHFTNEADLATKIDKNRRNIIATFPDPTGAEYDNLIKVAGALREDCVFWIGKPEPGQPGTTVKYQAPQAADRALFTLDMKNLDQLKRWASDQCVPLVREITFANAEELTEEGKPFLILFRQPDDEASLKKFTEVVSRDIPDLKQQVNCLSADGNKFSHPLHHLGKKLSDLPLIAIDSFRHMYLFSSFNDLDKPNALRQFVMDLQSGKLHREFHHGPDAPAQAAGGAPETQPPPSVFEKLKPSHNRYSFGERDEL